jgi:hypothetical protein
VDEATAKACEWKTPLVRDKSIHVPTSHEIKDRAAARDMRAAASVAAFVIATAFTSCLLLLRDSEARGHGY